MDVATPAGIGLAFAVIVGSMVMEGGNPASLIAPPALVLVFGGTLMVSMAGGTIADFKLSLGALKTAFTGGVTPAAEVVPAIVSLADKARREGLLALETEVASAGDAFLQKGIQLVADGLDQDTIKDMLETELDFVASRHAACYGMLDAMGGFAPTMGIIGTVMGLISVLAHMDNVDNLGPAIAVAFVATLYGVGTANLLWLPMGQKLKRKSEEELLLREVMIAGIISIQAGDNPQIVEEKLKSYLSPTTRKQIARGGRGGEPAPKGKK